MIDYLYRAGRTRAVAFRDGSSVDGEATAVTKPTFEEARDEFFFVPALSIMRLVERGASTRAPSRRTPPLARTGIQRTLASALAAFILGSPCIRQAAFARSPLPMISAPKSEFLKELGMKSQFDADDNNEYLVFDSNPTSSSSRSLGTKAYRFKKREFSDVEVAGAGLLAGATVEVARTIVTYPLDTLRTRLQSDPGLAREVARALLVAALNTSYSESEGLEPVAQASDAHAAAVAPMHVTDAHAAAVTPMQATTVAVAPGRAAARGSWWEGLWEGLGTALLSSPPQVHAVCMLIACGLILNAC